MLGVRHRLGDVFAVGEYRQIVLLAIGEAVALYGHLIHEQRIGLVGLELEGHAARLASLHAEGELLLRNSLVALGVYQLQLGNTADSALGGVEDAGGQTGLVAHTQEAGHVGLYHHVLLGNGLIRYTAVTHAWGVGNSHEAPSGQTLGQRELQRYLTLLVGHQHGIAEGSLVQILAQLHLFLWLGFLGSILFGSTLLERHRTRRHRLLFCGIAYDHHLVGGIVGGIGTYHRHRSGCPAIHRASSTHK